jgi:hypothetical protein
MGSGFAGLVEAIEAIVAALAPKRVQKNNGQ